MQHSDSQPVDPFLELCTSAAHFESPYFVARTLAPVPRPPTSISMASNMRSNAGTICNTTTLHLSEFPNTRSRTFSARNPRIRNVCAAFPHAILRASKQRQQISAVRPHRSPKIPCNIFILHCEIDLVSSFAAIPMEMKMHIQYIRIFRAEKG